MDPDPRLSSREYQVGKIERVNGEELTSTEKDDPCGGLWFASPSI